MDTAILRRIVEIQIEQGDLLKRLARIAAIHEVNTHNYFTHGSIGSSLRDESRREMGRIEEQLERIQERLRKLVSELCQAPVSVTV